MSDKVVLNEAALSEMFADPAGPVGQIIEKKAYNVEGVWKELLLIPGSGRLYTTRFYRGRAGRTLGNGVPQVPGKLYAYPPRTPHRASAPGFPPASDSGALLASIGHEIIHDEAGHVAAEVFADKKYAIYLEFGTRAMQPRPFMRPGLDVGLHLP